MQIGILCSVKGIMNVSKEILLFLIGILLEISVVSRSVTSDVKTKLIDINEFSPDKVHMK